MIGSSKFFVFCFLFLVPFCVYVTIDFPKAQLSAYGIINLNFAEPAEEELFVLDLEVEPKILITGDILYARDVERNAEKYGEDYPFSIFYDLPLYSAVVSNFESTIPEVHVKTPSQSTRFSSKKVIAPILFEHGVTHVSLANNHALDFGNTGFESTEKTLEESFLTSFGHPTKISTSSVSFIEAESTTVAFVALHTLFAKIDEALYSHFIQYAADNADYVVVYIHWGEEYVTTHNAAQQRLAHSLIDAGADAVVGHHPHVVQDVERYAGKLIFYSLGNFVFDQYFSMDVQEGLLLELSFTENNAQFDLKPISSIGGRNKPRLMPNVERGLFLESLSKRSQIYLQDEILSGTITGNL